MEPTDLTIEILKDIRDAVHETNERLDAALQAASGPVHPAESSGDLSEKRTSGCCECTSRPAATR